MKMRKLLSIGALTLAVVSCTSIGASAAEVAGPNNKKQAMQAMVQKGLDGGNVFDAVSINAKTSVGKYLTATFIREINEELEKKELNKYTENGQETWEVKPTDNYYAIEKNIAKTIRSLDEEKRNKALNDIKNFLKEKLDEFKEASLDSDKALKDKVEEYLIVPSGSTLTVGKNSDKLRVVSLENKNNGKIIAQINSGNVYKAAEKLDSVKDYDQLKSLIMSYYPGAKDYYDKVSNEK